jgi:hypothetical protein
MARKNDGKAVLWRGIVRRQPESGLSIRDFCAAEGISEPSFYAWRKKLRQGPDDGAETRRSSRHEQVSGDAPFDNAPLFVPLKLVDAAAMLEIVHPLGYRIQVTGDVNRVALRHVIETLDERGTR